MNLAMFLRLSLQLRELRTLLNLRNCDVIMKSFRKNTKYSNMCES